MTVTTRAEPMHFYEHWYLTPADKRAFMAWLESEGIGLYGGITNNPDLRLTQHNGSKGYAHLGHVTVQWPTTRTRAEAEAWEARWIKERRWPYNQKGNPSFASQADERALIESGDVDEWLANPTKRWLLRLRLYGVARAWWVLAGGFVGGLVTGLLV